MSDIPKSERSESPLRAQHMVYNIRKRITAELMATFGYSEKHFEKHLKAVTAYVVDDGEREELAKRIREQAVPLLPASADRLLADELWQSDSED